MAEQRIQRRLAAILAADVVGYSRQMDGVHRLHLLLQFDRASDRVDTAPELDQHLKAKSVGRANFADFIKSLQPS